MSASIEVKVAPISGPKVRARCGDYFGWLMGCYGFAARPFSRICFCGPWRGPMKISLRRKKPISFSFWAGCGFITLTARKTGIFGFGGSFCAGIASGAAISQTRCWFFPAAQAIYSIRRKKKPCFCRLKRKLRDSSGTHSPRGAIPQHIWKCAGDEAFAPTLRRPACCRCDERLSYAASAGLSAESRRLRLALSCGFPQSSPTTPAFGIISPRLLPCRPRLSPFVNM